MYAVHSIPYTAANQNALRSYFYGFGVWDENNTLLAWDQTIEVFQMLDINPASVLYHGPYHDGLADELAAKIDPARQESFVLRNEGRSEQRGEGEEGVSRGRFWGGRSH